MNALRKLLAESVRSVSRPPGFIDVKQLINELTDAELLAAADAYFLGLSTDSEQCYKPFSNASDAINITRNLSLLLEAADLFRGADVLDFGCATGWLTLAVASLGCHAVGVDISPAALQLAQNWCTKQGIRAGGSVRFEWYDGHRLPLEDNSVDRILCFDAFHHVKDQASTLRELARVLRPGGRIAMLEPGPLHSRTPQSQAEMAQFRVIENDIVIADIAAAGTAAGLELPQLLVQMHQPLEVTFDQYSSWANDKLAKADGDKILARLQRHLVNTQCFYLSKPGITSLDSRRPEALAARLRLVSFSLQPGEYELVFEIQNVGEAAWICKPGALGMVNLGCQLLRPDNTLEKLDYIRFPVGGNTVIPGETVIVAVRLPCAEGAGQKYRFDLVAENIGWFEPLGRTQSVNWTATA